jgi:2-oxoglutarate ferredoxin oxidoreductase subunit alpha
VLLALQPLHGHTTFRWIDDKFKAKPALVQANRMAMQAGYSYCEATEAFQITYEIPPAKLAPGLYRNVSGNTALAMGFVAASQKAGIPLFLGSPRLPTSCTNSRGTRISA